MNTNKQEVKLNAYCPQCEHIVYAEWIKSPTGLFALCTNHGMKMVECEIRSSENDPEH